MNSYIIDLYIKPITFKIHCVKEDGEIYVFTKRTSIYVEPIGNLDDDRFNVEEILQYRNIGPSELNFFNTIFYLRNNCLQYNCYENFEDGDMNPKVLKSYDHEKLRLRKLNDISFKDKDSIKSFVYENRVHYIIFIYYIITYFEYANDNLDPLYECFELKYTPIDYSLNEIMINFDSLTCIQKDLAYSYWKKLGLD